MENNKRIKNEDLLGLFDIQSVGPEGNLQLADPVLVNYYKGQKERKLFITQDIDDSIINFTQSLILWNAEDEYNNIPIENRKPVIIYLLSYGGQLDQIMTLIDIIKISKMTIKIINLGVAASAGCLLLMSGTKGYRYTLRNSWGLIHQGQGGAGGTAEAVIAQTQNYKRILETVKNHILENTNIDLKTYNKYKTKEWYVYPNDMLKYGIVDKIVDDISEII